MTASIAEYKKYKEEMANKPALDLTNPKILAESKGCLACHAVDVKLVGPSYNEVANKERNKDVLIHSIHYGSVNKYDVIPMPAQDASDEEAQILVDWILSLKDTKK